MRISFNISALLLFLKMAQAVEAQGLIIPSGAYVVANNGNIVMGANWINNGSFTHNGGAVIFAGSIQTLGGSSSTLFNNLTVAAGSRTTITSPGQQLRGVLLSNDTLNANGNITLISTAAQTALISGSGNGEVIGNLTMQRYLATGFGYKYFSSPFRSDTVNDFSQEINLSTSFPDFYRFDESLNSAGWANYTNPSGSLVPFIGYAVNFGASSAPVTVSLTGVVNNHTISTPVLYNHNMTYTQGFNLGGNPYPSPVDWDAPGGWTRTNVDNAIYFFSAGTTDQYTGTYSSYVNGISSNGIASNLIAAMQGFFIHVSAGSFPVTGQLSVTNAARNLNPSTTFLGVTIPSGPPPLLRLTAGFADKETSVDPLVFYCKTAAGMAFDKKLDALKLMNTHPLVPNLYALSSDAQKLSIYGMPACFDSLVNIPLGLTTSRDGWISFMAPDILNIPANLFIYLTDTKTGVIRDLKKDLPYRLYLQSGDYAGRFFLQFSTKERVTELSVAAGSFQAYSAAGTLFVNGNLSGSEEGDLRIVNIPGQIIWRQTIRGNIRQAILFHFTPGVYIVNLITPEGAHTKKIFIGPQ